MSRYKRVPHRGTVLTSGSRIKGPFYTTSASCRTARCTIRADTPEDIVRSAVLAADARRRARASAAAVKAARTREAKAYAVVARKLGRPARSTLGRAAQLPQRPRRPSVDSNEHRWRECSARSNASSRAYIDTGPDDAGLNVVNVRGT